MVSRAESAAATRAALVDAAATLLAQGGPDAVTLRGVGELAGVSRGAPYGHFDSKETLLAALATAQWDALADQLRDIRASTPAPRDQLASTLRAWLQFARAQPHLYAQMFVAPSDPTALLAAAARAQDAFLAIVGDAVGEHDSRRTGAVLLAATHGIAGLERAGQFGTDKWAATADELIDVLIERVV